MSDIVDRIRKLLALAGNNPNENEAMAALEKAFTLAAKHNVDVNSLRDKPANDGIVEEITTNKQSEKQFWFVWQAVARLNACEYLVHRLSQRRRETRHFLYGRRVNVVTAAAMAGYLCNVMRALAVAYASEHVKARGGSQARYFNSFMHGFSRRVYSRCEQMRIAAESGDLKGADGRNLPALLNQYEADRQAIAARLGPLSNKKTRSTANVDPHAFVKGAEAGQNVGIHRQLGGGGS